MRGGRLPIEVVVPPEFRDAVEQDLERRGGLVRASSVAVVIKGEIPPEDVDGYGAWLRSLTRGFGTFRAGRAPSQ